MPDQNKIQPNPEADNTPNKRNHASTEKNNAAGAEKNKNGFISLKHEEYAQLLAKAQEADANLDRFIRAQAEFENARKRLERQNQDFVKFANEDIIKELLNILDDLERAIEVAQAKHQDLPVFLKGVEMILAHLYDMLKEHGVKPIEAEGKIFDPHYHEALVQAEDANLPEHTVVEELQKGYLLNDRIIRTAKVKVSKKIPQSTGHSPE